MIRQLGRRLGLLVAQLHREHGVGVMTGVGVRLLGDQFVEGAELADRIVEPTWCWSRSGRPRDRLARRQRASLQDGVVCNAECEAAPGIFAVGDVAQWFNPRFGIEMRVEHRAERHRAGCRGRPQRARCGGADSIRFPISGAISSTSASRRTASSRPTARSSSSTATRTSGSSSPPYSRDGVIQGVVAWNARKAIHHYRQSIGAKSIPRRRGESRESDHRRWIPAEDADGSRHLPRRRRRGLRTRTPLSRLSYPDGHVGWLDHGWGSCAKCSPTRASAQPARPPVSDREGHRTRGRPRCRRAC